MALFCVVEPSKKTICLQLDNNTMTSPVNIFISSLTFGGLLENPASFHMVTSVLIPGL